MMKTIAEINEKIHNGQAIVATREEIINITKEKGTTKAAREIDGVTTGTFDSMCSSSAYFSTGHTKLRINWAMADTMAEFVGSELLVFSTETIVENGSDIYLKIRRGKVIGIYTGKPSFTGKIGLEINGPDTPLRTCTTLGTVGYSSSYGQTDAIIVLAPPLALADTVATATGNLIDQPINITNKIEKTKGIKGCKRAVIIRDGSVGLWGEVKTCPVSV